MQSKKKKKKLSKGHKCQAHEGKHVLSSHLISCCMIKQVYAWRSNRVGSYNSSVKPGCTDRRVLASGQSILLNLVCGKRVEMVLRGLGFLKERGNIREKTVKERQRMFIKN